MQINEKVSLKELTTFKVGGNARFFCLVENMTEFGEANDFARKNNLPVLILGGGSNLLVGDSGFDGLVIKMNFLGLNFCEGDETVEVVAKAGENWDRFVATTVERNLSGLENLSGIPGTVGATPVQNVGAYGVEVKDLINGVEAVNLETGEIKRFSNEECQFDYRSSFFKTAPGKKFVIVAVSYILSTKFQPNISYNDLAVYFSMRQPQNASEVRDVVLAIRASKFPDLNKIGTAGSFFKNPIITKEKFDELKHKYPDLPGFPVELPSGLSTINHKLPTIKLSLAWILDKICQLRGFRHRSIGLFENQPLVLVNYGGAGSKEIKKFSKLIKEKVFRATGIVIEEEVQFV